MKPVEDVVTIDPVAMNVVNRVAPGTVLEGDLTFEGGVLVQGMLGGNVLVRGRAVVWAGGLLRGRVRVAGDMYVFGQLGEHGAAADQTHIECMGTLYLASSGVSSASVSARQLMMYEGADLRGPFTTLRPGPAAAAAGDRVQPAQPAPARASAAR